MKVALVGVGMIGGSLLAAWRRSGVLTAAVGYDIDAAALDEAIARGLIDRRAQSVTDAARGADTVVVATPVGAMREVFAQLAPVLTPEALLVDAGSSKAGVIDDARATLGARLARFVPAHPIAGKELPGVAHAQADLFDGKRLIVTPIAETDAAALAQAERLFALAGARVERMAPDEHDRIFAAVSHLPHLLSFALVASVGGEADGPRKLGYGGAGFRDFTRIAASSATMWRDICLANRTALGEELRIYRAALERLQQAVDSGDGGALLQTFARAAQLRRELRPSLDDD